MDSFHIAPLLLLATVAATGLALPATRGDPAWFATAAWTHEIAVIAMLLAIPFSKLSHVLSRPLQLGAQLNRSLDRPRAACTDCGAMLAPTEQLASVRRLLASSGASAVSHLDLCGSCRRRAVAVAQTGLTGACFQPRIAGARPAPSAPVGIPEVEDLSPSATLGFASVHARKRVA